MKLVLIYVRDEAKEPFDETLDFFNDAAHRKRTTGIPIRSLRERCAEIAIPPAPTPRLLGATHGQRGSP